MGQRLPGNACLWKEARAREKWVGRRPLSAAPVACDWSLLGRFPASALHCGASERKRVRRGDAAGVVVEVDVGGVVFWWPGPKLGWF